MNYAVSFWDLFRGDKYPSYFTNTYTGWEGIVLLVGAGSGFALWLLIRVSRFHVASALLVCLAPLLAGLIIGVVNASLVLYPQEWIGPPPELYAWEALFCSHIGLYCTLLLTVAAAAISIRRRNLRQAVPKA